MKLDLSPYRQLWAARAAAMGALALCALTLTHAQTTSADFKARFDREVALCNQSGLPDPAREACIRQAGLAFDRATGGVTGSEQVTTPDGRATVIVPTTGAAEPAGSPRPSDAPSALTTTPDGRATVVNPPVR